MLLAHGNGRNDQKDADRSHVVPLLHSLSDRRGKVHARLRYFGAGVAVLGAAGVIAPGVGLGAAVFGAAADGLAGAPPLTAPGEFSSYNLMISLVISISLAANRTGVCCELTSSIN